MKKVVALLIIFALLSSTSLLALGITKQEEGIDPIQVTDPQGDHHGPDYTDIMLVGMYQYGSYQAVATMALSGSIPKDPPSYIGYVWKLDTDLNSDTGQSLGGSEYNLRVAYSPGKGWNAYIDDITHNRAMKVEDFQIGYHDGIVGIKFPLGEISYPEDLNFMGSIAFRQSRPDVSDDRYIDLTE